MSSHLAVFVILAIAYHFQYHPSFKMYSIPNFSRMSRENATLVRQAMNNEKKIIAISWLKKIRSQHVMEQRLRAVIKKVEVWQHEVRNGGVAAGNKSKEILPATPYNLKVREIPAEGGNSTTVKFTLVWESDNLNSNDNNNAEIESSPIFYKIALQKLPSHTLLGSFEVVATVENKNQVVLESLEPATTYEVKVCAYNDVGESLWSKLYKFKTSSMFTNASREVVSMDGDVGNNDSTSTGNVKDDETKSTSPAEQLQDESMSNLEDDDESACCTNTWQYFVSHTEYLSTFFALLAAVLSPSIFSMVYPVIIFCFGMLERKRHRHKAWNVLLYYTLFVLVLKFFLEFVTSIVGFDDTKDSTRNFFLIPPMYNANRGFGFWYIEIVLVPLILMHRYFSEKKGLWPLQRNIPTSNEHTNLASNVREKEKEVEHTYDDWADEIQALYAETRQGEQRDKAAKYDALGLKKPTVSTEGYLSRMAPIYKLKNVLSYGFELKVDFDDCELSTEDQNRIFLHLMEITGDKFMLKKPGRYYYGHMFGMMMLSSVWMYLRHLIPGYDLTDDNVDDHQNFFQQDQIAFIFVLVRVFVAIVSDRRAYVLADLRWKLFHHYTFITMMLLQMFYRLCIQNDRCDYIL
jgi:hypothetical protein